MKKLSLLIAGLVLTGCQTTGARYAPDDRGEKVASPFNAMCKTTLGTFHLTVDSNKVVQEPRDPKEHLKTYTITRIDKEVMRDESENYDFILIEHSYDEANDEEISVRMDLSMNIEEENDIASTEAKLLVRDFVVRVGDFHNSRSVMQSVKAICSYNLIFSTNPELKS